MTHPDDPRPATRADARRQPAEESTVPPARRRRGWLIAGAVVGTLVVLGGAAAWVAWQVYARATDVRAELVAAQQLLPDVTQSAAALDFDAASASLAEAAAHTASAVALTDDPLWHVAAGVPLVGGNIAAVDELAKITDEALRAAQPLIAAGPTLLPANFAPVDGAIPIQPLRDAQPVVRAASTAIDALDARLSAVDTSGVIEQIASAKVTLVDALGSVKNLLDTADTALSIAPQMLGADTPQIYVVMFLNNAELRSLGGTALSFAELRVDAGRIELVQAMPAGFGNFAITEPVVPVPEGFADFAPGQFGTFITNAGIRPSMQSAAEVVSANWQREFGRLPDAVVSMDVVALSYVLGATGAVEAGGWTIDQSNAVDVLLNEVLNAFDTGNLRIDNARQDAVYAAFVDQTFARITAGTFDMSAMIDAIGRAAGERRILAWSSQPGVNEELAQAGMELEIPDRRGDDAVVGLYINDYVGSKLNYYLDTAVMLDPCRPEGGASATLTLTSTLPADSVEDINPAVLGAYAQSGTAPGVQRLRVFAYAPTGSTVTAASIDGAAIDITPYSDAGHPVQVFELDLKPGTTQQITIEVTTPEGASSVVAELTPTVRAARVEQGATC